MDILNHAEFAEDDEPFDGRAGEITALLAEHAAGRREAFDRLVPLVYGELQKIARQQRYRAVPFETLDTSALIHEAYLKLADETGVEWSDRFHFFAIAARTMRRTLVDYARERGAQKRGGDRHQVPLEVWHGARARSIEDVLGIDRALRSLEKVDERLVRVVECRYFAGLTEAETAKSLDLSRRSVQRYAVRARAWLLRELAEESSR